MIEVNQPPLRKTPVVGSSFSGSPISEVYLMDCIEGMKHYPDKYFDLACIDPPYGIEDKISIGGGSHTKNKSKFHQLYKENGKTWDKERPNKSFLARAKTATSNAFSSERSSTIPVSRIKLILLEFVIE